MQSEDPFVPCTVGTVALEPLVCALATRPRVPAGRDGFLDGGQSALLLFQMRLECVSVDERGLYEDNSGVWRYVIGEELRRVQAIQYASVREKAKREGKIIVLSLENELSSQRFFVQ